MASTHRAPRRPVEMSHSRPQTAPSSGPALPPWLRHSLRTVLHLALDAAAVAGSFYAAYAIRFHWAWWVSRFPIPGAGVPAWGMYAHLLYAIVPLWLAIFWYSCRLYATPWMTATD